MGTALRNKARRLQLPTNTNGIQHQNTGGACSWTRRPFRRVSCCALNLTAAHRTVAAQNTKLTPRSTLCARKSTAYAPNFLTCWRGLTYERVWHKMQGQQNLQVLTNCDFVLCPSPSICQRLSTKVLAKCKPTPHNIGMYL